MGQLSCLQTQHHNILLHVVANQLSDNCGTDLSSASESLLPLFLDLQEREVMWLVELVRITSEDYKYVAPVRAAGSGINRVKRCSSFDNVIQLPTITNY